MPRRQLSGKNEATASPCGPSCGVCPYVPLRCSFPRPAPSAYRYSGLASARPNSIGIVNARLTGCQELFFSLTFWLQRTYRSTIIEMQAKLLMLGTHERTKTLEITAILAYNRNVQPKLRLERTISRFLNKVIPEPMSGCWLWLGGVLSRGPWNYGQSYLRGKAVSAHRAAYLLFIGPIPRGLVLHHRCHTPLCCNPKHLQPMTKTRHLADTHPANLAYRNKRKTHCPYGHPYTEDNTIRFRNNRQCRICSRRGARERARKKGKATRPYLMNPDDARTLHEQIKQREICRNGHRLDPKGAAVCTVCLRESARRRYLKRIGKYDPNKPLW